MENKQLSAHFSLSEMCRSDTALRMEIDNTIMTDQILQNAKVLAEKVLEPIRTHFNIPFTPTSWYRSEQLEKAINQKAFARWCDTHKVPVSEASWTQYFSLKSHPKGEAADIVIPGVSNQQLFDWIKMNLEFDQLIMEYINPANKLEAGWVHVSYRAGANRKQAFSMDGRQ